MKLGVVSAAPSLQKESALYVSSLKFQEYLIAQFVENATMNNAEVIERLSMRHYTGELLNYKRQKTYIRTGLSESPPRRLYLSQRKTG
jgi:hypothetical protein